MRRILTTCLIAAMLLVPATGALALEDGATFFDNGSCVEADGTAGLAGADGSCVTPADYDAMFSYENLSQIPSQTFGSTQSIAEEAGMVPDTVKASERQLGAGLVEKTFTFTDRVEHWFYVGNGFIIQ